MALEAAEETIEEEEEATEVADKTMMTEALLGAEDLELAQEVVTVVKEATKTVVASDQRPLVLQVAVHQWLKRVVAQAQWCMCPTFDSK